MLCAQAGKGKRGAVGSARVSLPYRPLRHRARVILPSSGQGAGFTPDHTTREEEIRRRHGSMKLRVVERLGGQ